MELTAPPTPASRGEAGFSLVELLVSALLLTVVVLGILPLFTRSAMDTVAGNEFMQLTNHGRTAIEELHQLPFNNDALTITAGTERTSTLHWAAGDPDVLGDPAEGWWPEAELAGKGLAPWIRTTRVHQYRFEALEDGVLDPGERLDSNAPPGDVHFKEIEVLVTDFAGGGFLSPGRQVELRTLKAF